MADEWQMDPFDEVTTELRLAQKALKECYAVHGGDEAYLKNARNMLKPLLQLAVQLKTKSTTLRQEHENAQRIDDLKMRLYRKCHQLGEDASEHVKFHADGVIFTFQESVEKLRTALSDLDDLEYNRISQMNEVIKNINDIKEELEEGQLIPEVRRPPPDTDFATTSFKSNSLRRGPKKKVDQFDALYGGTIIEESGVEDPHQVDLSQERLTQYKLELQGALDRKATRAKKVAELAQDILALWKEDGRVPNPSDGGLSELEQHLAMYSKIGPYPHNLKASGIDLKQSTLQQIVSKKKEMTVNKDERIKSSLEMQRRLKLIEDRQFILAGMKRFEARCKNPLRLFADSTQLMEEDRYRMRMYPRLLLIESVLRPALVQWKEKHHRPFLYQGMDYLRHLDEELQTRTIPRHLFALAPSPMQQHTSFHNMPHAVLKALSSPAEDHEPDFARVLELSVAVDNIVSERIMSEAERLEDIKWHEMSRKTPEQSEAERKERQLLELGWKLPANMPPDRIMKINPSPPASRKNSGRAPKPLMPNLSVTKTSPNLSQATYEVTLSSTEPSEVPQPPSVDVTPTPCSDTHSAGSSCSSRSRNPIGVLGSTDIFAEPPAPRIVKESALLRGTRTSGVPKQSRSGQQRVKLTATQLENIKAPKHIRFSETDSAKKLKARVDAAYRR